MKVKPVRRIDDTTYYTLIAAMRGATLDKIAKNDLYRKGLAQEPKESERRTWLTDLGRSFASMPPPQSFRMSRTSPEDERRNIEQALAENGGNESAAARKLGIRRGRLRRLMSKSC